MYLAVSAIEIPFKLQNIVQIQNQRQNPDKMIVKKTDYRILQFFVVTPLKYSRKTKIIVFKIKRALAIDLAFSAVSEFVLCFVI